MSVVELRPRSGRSTDDPAQPAAPAGPAVVNLLSPWVLEQVRADRLRKQLVYGVLALVVLVGLAWGAQQLRLSEARAELRGEQAVGHGLEARITALAPVESYVGAVRAKATTVGGTMWTEIEFSRALQRLRDTLPDGVRLDDVALTMPGAGDPTTATTSPATTSTATAPTPEQLLAGRGIVAACPGPDPFHTRTIVGCVTVAGTAPDRRTVAELVRRLADERLFVEPFVSTTTTAADVPVTFSGSVGLSPDVFSGRYDGLLDLDRAEQQGGRR